MILLISLLILCVITWGVYTQKEIRLAVINGFMFGFLYDVEDFDDEKWHTVQILLGFLSINILWETY